ncbi:MAG: hypothetical protein WCK70_06250 [Chloroflexales bacterium]
MNDNELIALAAKLSELREEFDETTARAAFEKKATRLTLDQRARVESLIFFGDGNQFSDVKIGDVAGEDIVKGTKGTTDISGTLYGAAVGVSTGIIQLFFGARPPADGRQILNAYLDALCERYRPLALSRLLTREQAGNEHASAPSLPLGAVYTALSTDARIPHERFTLTPDELDRALAAANPDIIPPDRLRLPVADIVYGFHEISAALRIVHPIAEARSLPEFCGTLRHVTARAVTNHDNAVPIVGQWYQPELAVECLAAARSRIVMLGDPGSGKSTVLRYLVVSIAEALLAGQTNGPSDLRGWEGRPLPVPIFCPLGPVAKLLDDNPAHDLGRIIEAVRQSVFGPSGLRADLHDMLLQAWHSGGVLLCFDGLDEVTGIPEPTQDGSRSRRERLAEALRCLSQQVGDSSVVITCRTTPYKQDIAWQMPAPWQVRRIEPFSFSQVRFFVEAWYAQSCVVASAKLTAEEGRRKADELLRAIPVKPGLRAICNSPLLLTMVVLLHYNQKQLPNERAEVYEELVGLLLDRWEWVRTNEQTHVPLMPFGERLALPQLRARDLRAALNQIAYAAHRTSSGRSRGDSRADDL